MIMGQSEMRKYRGQNGPVPRLFSLGIYVGSQELATIGKSLSSSGLRMNFDWMEEQCLHYNRDVKVRAMIGVR